MTVKNLLTVFYTSLFLPTAVILTLYLYFYPSCHFCAFHTPPSGADADFRLLTLADPQIEGDSTLSRYQHRRTTSINKNGESQELGWMRFVQPDNIQQDLEFLRKSIDLWGNDLYLAHVYRTMKRHLKPTHTVVLGDLVGSQWISDEEFEKRGKRFWEIFSGGEKVTAEDIEAGDVSGERWKNKIINIAGNHDIGYAGDITRRRIERFEEMFGAVNYQLSYTIPNKTTSPDKTNPDSSTEVNVPPKLRIVILNSLTLDAPILDQTLSNESYSLVTKVLQQNSPSSRQSTLLLTHLPFYKPAGVCVDAPYTTYFDDRQGGGIKEQNHLSETASHFLLAQIFGLPDHGTRSQERKARGIVLTGHDHEGCEVQHWWDDTDTNTAKEEDEQKETGKWKAETWQQWTEREEQQTRTKNQTIDEKNNPTPQKDGIREITVRSMMGEFGGNAGLLSAWFDPESESWKFEYSACGLGVQHLWWAVHIIDLVAVGIGILLLLMNVVEYCSAGAVRARGVKAKVEMEKKKV